VGEAARAGACRGSGEPGTWIGAGLPKAMRIVKGGGPASGSGPQKNVMAGSGRILFGQGINPPMGTQKKEQSDT